MKKQLFVTATDTNVGKTFITCQLIHHARKLGKSVHAVKPVGTGSNWNGTYWTHPDAEAIRHSLVLPDTEQIMGWHFAEALAPAVAMRREGQWISLEKLTFWANQQRGDADRFIIEGVGGLLCPLSGQHTVADWIAELQIPTLLVVSRSLGTLNHTLLTLEAMKRREICCLGIVVNTPNPDDSLAATLNEQELSRCIDLPIVGSYPFLRNGSEPGWLNDALIWPDATTR